MKKNSICLLLLMLSVLSCSDSNDSNNDPALSAQALSGIWYVKDVIKPDGTIEPYIHSCSTQRDYAEFFNFGKIQFHYNNVDCTSLITADGCDSFILNNDTGVLSVCSNMFQGTITEFTDETLRIDYTEEEFFGYTDNNFQSGKGIIFSRN